MARRNERNEADIEGFDIAARGGAESGVFDFEAREGNKGESPGLSPRSGCQPDTQTDKVQHAQRTGHPPNFWGNGGKSIDNLSVQKQEHPDTKITAFPVAEQENQAGDADHYALVFDSGFSCHSATELTECASPWPEEGQLVASFSGRSSWHATPSENSAPQKDPNRLDYKEWRDSGACQTQSDTMVYRSDISTSIPGCACVCGDAAGTPHTMVSEKERRGEEMKKKDESQVIDDDDRFDSGICSVDESASPASKIFQNQVVSLRSGFSDLRLALSRDGGKEKNVHSCEDEGVTFPNPTACSESETLNIEHIHGSILERIQAVSSDKGNGSRNTKYDRRDETVIPCSKTETKSDSDCRESSENCPCPQHPDADTTQREKMTETTAADTCLYAGNGRHREGSDVTRDVGRPETAEEPTHPEWQGGKQTPECVQRTERSRVAGSDTPKFLAVLMGIRDEDGDTFLHNGIVHGQAELVVSLLHQLAWNPPYHTATQEFLDASNYLSQTALHLAVVTSQYDVIKALVLAGASLEGRDLQGNTPLHVACGRGNLLAALMLVSPATREERAGGEEGGSETMVTQRGISRNLQLRNYEGDYLEKSLNNNPDEDPFKNSATKPTGNSMMMRKRRGW
ncbi:hypothetical protein C0Q70_13897 [Pomacea canaliculata]|uniref:Uncharacterized protein n=1 Tax=Pomacea canaliculata TaxID=400727 RepID=A0A2T7NYH2_POMCA|nr:hypothetical protein C0Q70_13897 [Pomacea canaliculata]